MYTSTVKLAVLITTVGVEVITYVEVIHEDVHVHFYCKTCRANYYSRCRGNYLHPHMRMCMYTSTVKLAVLITTVIAVLHYYSRCRGNYLHPHMRMYTSTVKLAVLITTVGVEVITYIRT